MASDQGPVVQSAVLRGELVRLRKERGLTQEQVAENLEWSASKLIRVEGGRSSITKVDLDALLGQYGVTSESQRERLYHLNRGARAVGWWNAYRNDVLAPYLNYVGYEAGAAFIRQFPGHRRARPAADARVRRALTVLSVEERNRVDSVWGCGSSVSRNSRTAKPRRASITSWTRR